ncbi:MAG: TIGR01777 family oxidoreductase [Balneolaceae bacterium]|nr:TIGR01777 family oxidoreductase [Balneolaceae bacterium]MDR9446575.1 TIGR01777 family oxidoreductase [Balneolaceae bacterium]
MSLQDKSLTQPSQHQDAPLAQETILLTGASGFIGSYLVKTCLQAGYYVILVSRTPEKLSFPTARNCKKISWDPDELASVMDSVDVVIHLAGESVAGRRWTPEVKKAIRSSRVETTRALVEAMRQAKSKPRVMISASAVGIYGNQGADVLTEKAPQGEDFLAEVCVAWEAEAHKAEDLGVEVAIPRIGIVLGKGQGVLEKMVPPFQWFIGGPVGDPSIYLPWIHVEDVVRALLHPVDQQTLRGPYNVCAPEPVTMQTFASALGWVMRRPSWFPVPPMLLKILFGEAAQPILSSMRAVPHALDSASFEFAYSDVHTALGDLL